MPMILLLAGCAATAPTGDAATTDAAARDDGARDSGDCAATLPTCDELRTRCMAGHWQWGDGPCYDRFGPGCTNLFCDAHDGGPDTGPSRDAALDPDGSSSDASGSDGG